MKKLLLILLCFPMIGFGQDVLLFQDGSKKDVTILEITPSIVKYQKFNSTSEVVYTEDKNTLLGVVFEDGGFEKFESRRGSSSIKRNLNQGDFGNNMFYFSPIIPFLGYVGIGYEHFSKSGKSSFRIPFKLQIAANNLSNGMVYLGYEYKFFPTGSSGGVRGFIGFEERIGIIELNRIDSVYVIYEWGLNNRDEYYEYYDNTSNYILSETHFTGGVQFHPSKLINITLDGGLGIGLLDFRETYLSYKIGLNLGFRF